MGGFDRKSALFNHFKAFCKWTLLQKFLTTGLSTLLAHCGVKIHFSIVFLNLLLMELVLSSTSLSMHISTFKIFSLYPTHLLFLRFRISSPRIHRTNIHSIIVEPTIHSNLSYPSSMTCLIRMNDSLSNTEQNIDESSLSFLHQL